MTERRHERVDVCSECGQCAGERCVEAQGPLRGYGGVRFTSDGFDCALPVAIDSHSHCSYACLYCFSDNLVQHREQTERPVGQTSLAGIERIFAGEGGKSAAIFREALRYGRATYPCPVQLGAINDPCDHIERQQGWLLKFIKLAIKYQQPVRISTKGSIFLLPEYQAAIAEAPHLFWVAFSIITADDRVLKRIDRRAPDATERLKTMAALSKLGVSTSLRFRPIIAGISDLTYRELVTKAAEAGARAVSYETAFFPGAASPDVRWRWQELSRVAGLDFAKVYARFGPKQACTRPSYSWTEDIMFAVRDVAREHGLAVGVSSPDWKQLNDYGCCCGIPPDDPVFGNWERENATNALLVARDTGRAVGPEDIIPSWAYKTRATALAKGEAGPLGAYRHRHFTWADELRDKWNGLDRERGPLVYFQGALMPDHQDAEGNWYYRYKGLERQYKHSPSWRGMYREVRGNVLPHDGTSASGTVATPVRTLEVQG